MFLFYMQYDLVNAELDGRHDMGGFAEMEVLLSLREGSDHH